MIGDDARVRWTRRDQVMSEWCLHKRFRERRDELRRRFKRTPVASTTLRRSLMASYGGLLALR